MHPQVIQARGGNKTIQRKKREKKERGKKAMNLLAVNVVKIGRAAL